MAGVEIFRTGIAPEWIDYNGHLRDAYYGLIISYATDALMERIGLDTPYRESTGCTLYTLEMHIHYLREIKATDTVVVEIRILAADHKRIHAAFELRCGPQAQPAATAEVMLLHVRQQPSVSSEPFPAPVAAAIGALQLAGAAFPAGAPGSRPMGLQQR
jgi:acyl-CoA thioester hydrolase